MTTYPNGIVSALLPGIDSILGVRDAVGAIVQPVYFVTRTWYTDAGLTVLAGAPEGYAKDVVSQMLPTPGVKTFAQNIRVREGGAIKAGDIILTNVSKNKYALSDLDGSTSGANIEKFYMFGVKLYQVITVTEKYVTWDVQLRELTNQTRY